MARYIAEHIQEIDADIEIVRAVKCIRLKRRPYEPKPGLRVWYEIVFKVDGKEAFLDLPVERQDAKERG